jgi:hypothetical protein
VKKEQPTQCGSPLDLMPSVRSAASECCTPAEPFTGNIDQGHIVHYWASKKDCSQGSLKPQCTTATMRKVTRDLNEDVRDRVRALADTECRYKITCNDDVNRFWRQFVVGQVEIFSIESMARTLYNESAASATSFRTKARNMPASI